MKLRAVILLRLCTVLKVHASVHSTSVYMYVQRGVCPIEHGLSTACIIHCSSSADKIQFMCNDLNSDCVYRIAGIFGGGFYLTN